MANGICEVCSGKCEVPHHPLCKMCFALKCVEEGTYKEPDKRPKRKAAKKQPVQSELIIQTPEDIGMASAMHRVADAIRALAKAVDGRV